MSYSFDGVNDELTGIFTTSRGLPLTLACYFKVTNHPLANQKILCLGASPTSANDSVELNVAVTDNQWGCRSTNSAGTNNTALEIEAVDNIWTPLVGVILNDADRTVYVKDITQLDNSVVSIVIGTALNDICIGRSLPGSNEFLGLIAEVAIWNTDLTSAQITSYMAGTVASSIAASNLIGYWPLSANGVLTNSGTDTGGDLTASGAVFDADHPTISSGLDPIRLIWRV